MGLIQCPECTRDVSSAASACPQCGYPLRAPTLAPPAPRPQREGFFLQSMNLGCMVIFGVIALGIAIALISSYNGSAR